LAVRFRHEADPPFFGKVRTMKNLKPEEWSKERLLAEYFSLKNGEDYVINQQEDEIEQLQAELEEAKEQKAKDDAEFQLVIDRRNSLQEEIERLKDYICDIKGFDFDTDIEVVYFTPTGSQSTMIGLTVTGTRPVSQALKERTG